MTTAAEDDLRAFVVARWPELEAVARVVALDPVVARRVTTDTLAALSGRWRETVEDGRPAEQARRGLLTAAVAVAAGTSPAASPRPADTGPHPAATVSAATDDDDDTVTSLLARTVTDLDPLDRALLAARVIWDASPGEVASLLALAPEELEPRSADLAARLSAAHDGARADAGLEPAPWALDRDLHDAVGLLLRGHDDPPDPATLIADRAGGLRRRRFLVGGVAAAGLVGAGWWVVGSGATAPRPTTAALPPAEDPVWDTTRRWPARGALATDPDVRALVVRDAPPGSRLLFADDVGDRRVVVASPADISGRAGVRVLVWAGPRGAPASGLQSVALARDSLAGVRDVVALVVRQDVGDALLVLGPPTLRVADYAAVVLPSPTGGSERTLTPVPLTLGVGLELVGRGLGPGAWVSVGGYEGPPAGTPRFRPRLLPNPSPADYARDCGVLVSDLTGVPDGLLSARVVIDSSADGAALDPDATGRMGRVVVVHTLTPDDAVVRSVRITTRGPSGTNEFDAETAAVVAAAEADGPVLVRLPRNGRSERFLVTASGAARVRLLSSAATERPVTRWVRCTGSSAVLTVPDSRQEGRYRVLVEDARGQELFRGLPPDSSELV